MPVPSTTDSAVRSGVAAAIAEAGGAPGQAAAAAPEPVPAPSQPALPASFPPRAASQGRGGSAEAEARPTAAAERPASPRGPPGRGRIDDAAAAGALLASGPTVSYPLPAGLDMANTNVIITGGTSGVGLEAAKVLCAKNAHVFILGHDPDKGRRALREVQGAVPKARVDWFECDLSSLRSVRTFAEAFKALGTPLHVLALNAGTFEGRYRRSPDGFEQSIATSFLGHLYLSHLLLPELQAATPSRLIWQASALEQLGSVPWGDLGGEFARDSDVWQYASAKLMCLMAAREMSRRLKGSGVDVFATHPGLVNTPLYDLTSPERPGSWLFSAAARVMGQSAGRAAASLIYAAGALELDGKDFTYLGPPYVGPLTLNAFNTARLTPLNPLAHSADACRRLYDDACALLEAKTGHRPLPGKLPGAHREHGWQERAAGKDRARPLEATVQPRS